MESNFNVHVLEGQSTSRPPLFNGDNFSYWKARMHIYLRCIDIDILDIVEKEYIENYSQNKTEEAKQLATLNIKAMNALICGLTPNEFNRVSTCKTAYEIWTKLCVTHEGTPQVKESKISNLMHEYELFKMLPNESIDAMFTRFTNVVNQLHVLDKVLENQEKNYKILRSLTPAWEPKATAIEEANDLTKLTLDGLIGKLKVHEKKIKEKEEEPPRTNEEPSPKMKSIALKGAIDNDSSSSDSDDDISREVAHLSKRISRLVKKSKNFKFNNSNKFSSRVGKCFECGEPGHLARDCPKIKEKYMKYKKKKAMYVGWEESEPSDSDEEEKAKCAFLDPNVCFMAHGDEVTSDSEDESFIRECELETALVELNIEFKRLAKEYSLFKKLHNSCDSKIESLQASMNDIIALKDKVIEDLDFENKQWVSKIERLEIENVMLKSKHTHYNHAHTHFGGKIPYKSYAPPYKKNFSCTYCMRHGHISTHCRIKANILSYGLMWMPKGTTRTNIQGPKIWVPKTPPSSSCVGNVSNKT